MGGSGDDGYFGASMVPSDRNLFVVRSSQSLQGGDDDDE